MFLPAIGFGIVSKLFDGIHRAVNSSEHNFKRDLRHMLEEADGSGPFQGMIPKELRDKIQRVLDTGKDQEIGTKINALMASGLIPPELGEAVLQLAQKNGVPNSSLDQQRFGEDMSEEDIRSVLGGTFSQELDEVASQQNQLLAGTGLGLDEDGAESDPESESAEEEIA